MNIYKTYAKASKRLCKIFRKYYRDVYLGKITPGKILLEQDNKWLLDRIKARE